MILDASFLVSVDRGDRAAQEFLSAALHRGTVLSSTHPVIAQVWRNGARQARLTKLLDAITVHALDDGPEVGALLARSRTADVVDAHLVCVAVRLSDQILTADIDDLVRLVTSLPDHRPGIVRWP